MATKKEKAENWEKSTKGKSKKEQILLGPKVVGLIAKEGVKRITKKK